MGWQQNTNVLIKGCTYYGITGKQTCLIQSLIQRVYSRALTTVLIKANTMLPYSQMKLNL